MAEDRVYQISPICYMECNERTVGNFVKLSLWEICRRGIILRAIFWCQNDNGMILSIRLSHIWLNLHLFTDEDFECAAVLTSHTQDVKTVIWHPHSDTLASCSYDNTIKLFKGTVRWDLDWRIGFRYLIFYTILINLY